MGRLRVLMGGMLLLAAASAMALEVISVSRQSVYPPGFWILLLVMLLVCAGLCVISVLFLRARHKAQRLDTLLRHVPDVITEVDARGMILGLNRGFGELPVAQIIGTSSYVYLSEQDGELFRRHLASALEQEVVSEYELEVALPDKTRWIQCRIVPLPNKQQRALVISADVSSFRESELMLEQARQQAEDAADSKSQFLAKMSHEIRTPLNGIVGVVHLLDETDNEQEKEQLKDSLFRSVEHLRHIVDDILDFSKVNSGVIQIELADTNLWQIVDDIEALYSQQTRDKGLHFSVHLGPGVPRLVKTDAFRLRQVLFNLMGNALKFTRKGFLRLNVTIQSLAGKNYLRFMVADSGVGMDESTLARIFEPFKQADDSISREFGGTGLGLAISRQLVECMGGLMGVESRKAEGSEFWFTIPLQPVKNEIELLSVWQEQGVCLDLLNENIQSWFEYFFSAQGIPLKKNAELLVTDHNLTPARWVWWLGNTPKPPAEYMIPLHLPLRREALLKRLSEQQNYKNEAENVMHEPHQDTAAVVNTTRILLVEDNPTNQMVVKKMLEKMGYEVEVADNGEAGVTAWQGSDFGAIIMDIQMPVMDGIEAARIIRQQEKNHIPIIALTANAQAEIEESCFAVGMDAFLTKPVNRGQLQTTLQGILGNQLVKRPQD